MDIRVNLSGNDANAGVEFVETRSFMNQLDPSKKLGYQIYQVNQISLGAYHAGVVVNDISTPGELVQLPQVQQEILNGFKNYLLQQWNKLERDDKELNELRDSYKHYMTQLRDAYKD